jgi:hypothetical protein
MVYQEAIKVLREKTVRQKQQQQGQQQEKEGEEGFLDNIFDSLKGSGGGLF